MVLENGANDVEKPNSIQEYISWLEKKKHIEHVSKERIYYKSIAAIAKRALEKTSFWTELSELIQVYNQEYLRKTGYNLFTKEEPPEILVKPFDSILNKSYRKNVLENKQWPNAPNSDWVLPSNWLSSLNDVLRTLFVVRYFDGVKFLSEKMHLLCDKHNIPFKVDFEAREEGYYAAHINTELTFEVPKRTWDTKEEVFSIEIQVTTQIQEVIRKLLHKYYEKKRVELKKSRAKWQWENKSDEFAANYLGHILHYVEGTILEIRDKQKKVAE